MIKYRKNISVWESLRVSELGNRRSSIDSESCPSCVLISTSNYCEESRWIPDGLSFAHPHTWPIKHIIDLRRFFFFYCHVRTWHYQKQRVSQERAQPELITVSLFPARAVAKVAREQRQWVTRSDVWQQCEVSRSGCTCTLQKLSRTCVKFREGTQICACSTHQQTFGCNGTVFSFFSSPPPSMLSVNLFPK